MNHRTAGILESTVLRLVGRHAVVSKVESMAEDFRLVTIQGEDLEGRAWTVGDMVQFSFGHWESRAYTPLAYDAHRGSLEFLGYVHGNGIGSTWLSKLKASEPCVFVGPRGALNLDVVSRPAVFFGDETSFSSAVAVRATKQGYRDVAFVFEVTSLKRSRAVLERFGLLDGTMLVQREPEDAHLGALEGHVLEALRARPSTPAIFTGKASSIQRLYKTARRAGVPGKQITNVAYWAPGKKGLSGVQRG